MDNYIAQADAELLTRKVGEINAQIIRLNAFGERLAGLAKIDKEEFAFDNDPAQGGVYEEVKTISSSQVSADEFAKSLRVLQQKIDGKQQQLDYLQSFFLREKVETKTKLSRRPIKKGWISSYFGKRKDPFTGKTAFHSGVDLAGKRGSDIVAVADGIVTWSGKRWAYGQMVEIDHGKGITTRYAHNDSLDAKVGELVKKGQVIAKMGSSGRSTGPHLHFEVRKNGKAVNPLKYIR
ncbi:MAG: M23 family metallopeptidase [Gammaproteobacteria bacterium]|nr:MAG: M23 family metallopeptidase [Gammaproteobacteria bacterium]